MEDDKVVDSITVRQDIGRYEPVYKRIVLNLWESGTVTWAYPPYVEEDW